jgi:hypothetical protein
MSILADIAVGKTDSAELFFFIAAILAGVGAIVAFTVRAFWATCVAAALCLGYIAWILL